MVATIPPLLHVFMVCIKTLTNLHFYPTPILSFLPLFSFLFLLRFMSLSLHPFPSSSSLFLPLHFFLSISVLHCDEILQADGNFMYQCSGLILLSLLHFLSPSLFSAPPYSTYFFLLLFFPSFSSFWPQTSPRHHIFFLRSSVQIITVILHRFCKNCDLILTTQ
jgi:hypothetical protein